MARKSANVALMQLSVSNIICVQNKVQKWVFLKVQNSNN